MPCIIVWRVLGFIWVSEPLKLLRMPANILMLSSASALLFCSQLSLVVTK